MFPAALIFDVDGTLADTEEQHRLAFNAAFAASGLQFAWDRAQYRELLQIGGGKERLAAFLARVGARGDVAAIHAEKTRRYVAAVHGGAVTLRPGVAALIDEAARAGIPLAIASTTSVASVAALLAASFGAAHPFAAIAAGDEVARKKPDPEVYALALARLGARAAECVAFEDSALGLRAALAAGLTTVIAPTYWTESDDFDGAAAIRPSLAGLTLDGVRALRA